MKGLQSFYKGLQFGKGLQSFIRYSSLTKIHQQGSGYHNFILNYYYYVVVNLCLNNISQSRNKNVNNYKFYQH